MPIMSQPSIGVLVRRITVGPVDDAALWIPFVFTAVLDRVANPQVCDRWCEIRVVRDQQRLSGWQSNDETLMLAAVLVIRKQACHDADTLNLRVARRGSQRWRRRDPLICLDGRILPRASGERHCGHCDEKGQMQGMRGFHEPPETVGVGDVQSDRLMDSPTANACHRTSSSMSLSRIDVMSSTLMGSIGQSRAEQVTR